MKREAGKLLHDILTACDHITQFTNNMDWQSWHGNIQVQAAVERKFEKIGEGLNRLRRQHPELASQVPEIGKMVDFRNFLIHEYHRVDPEIVWRIVKDNLPDLQITIQKLLTELDSPPDNTD